MLNKRIFRISLFLNVLILSLTTHAQQNVTTLGVQIKPMIPSKFLNTGPTQAESDKLKIGVDPLLGWNYGMVVRRGITKMWSFETGISMVQRNYRLRFEPLELTQKPELTFRLIGYEIPLQALLYVQLGEQLWMNTSAGLSLDLFPSNVQSSSFFRQDSSVYDFYQKTWRNGWLKTSVLANIGFEWRSKKDGYFYLGTSYHRPFTHIGWIDAEFTENKQAPKRLVFPLYGNYLTADFRYFFHEKPERKKPASNN